MVMKGGDDGQCEKRKKKGEPDKGSVAFRLMSPPYSLVGSRWHVKETMQGTVKGAKSGAFPAGRLRIRKLGRPAIAI
jgi:hypothetical protein